MSRRSLLTAELMASPVPPQPDPVTCLEDDPPPSSSPNPVPRSRALSLTGDESQDIRMRYYQALNLKSVPISVPQPPQSSIESLGIAFSAPVSIPIAPQHIRNFDQPNANSISPKTNVHPRAVQSIPMSKFVPPHELVKREEGIESRPHRKDKAVL
eukprot:c4498_g1_i1.p1 GENE.c4498_g1_i1~~c4498_g1_i1.p1  ORF type:complete len:156 (+),score=11.29 c4498_g1_i1:190-657(+)